MSALEKSKESAPVKESANGSQGTAQAPAQAIVMSEEEKALVGIGLTLKEAKSVISMRNSRSESIGIRVNKEELKAVNELHDYLLLHGYIAEGRANLLMYLVSTTTKPAPTQLEADLK